MSVRRHSFYEQCKSFPFMGVYINRSRGQRLHVPQIITSS